MGLLRSDFQEGYSGLSPAATNASIFRQQVCRQYLGHLEQHGGDRPAAHPSLGAEPLGQLGPERAQPPFGIGLGDLPVDMQLVPLPHPGETRRRRIQVVVQYQTRAERLAHLDGERQFPPRKIAEVDRAEHRADRRHGHLRSPSYGASAGGTGATTGSAMSRVAVLPPSTVTGRSRLPSNSCQTRRV